MNFKNKLSIVITGFVAAAIGVTNSVGATNQITPPGFPQCAELSEPGNWVTSRYGDHHIPGQEATITGTDDIYYLEGGNFLQCICADDDNQSTQTVWWNITNLGLTQDQIDEFVAGGWFVMDGGAWNLLQNNTYLAKNSGFSCQETEPTPTPTVPQEPTPTPPVEVTPTPTTTQPTPTPSGEEARCTGIEANPAEGTAALYVKFAAAGYDSAGDIKEYRFDFGDNSDNQPQRITNIHPEGTHVYHNPGTYKAKVEVVDSRGVSHGGNSECEVEITVKDSPEHVPQIAGSVHELPETGVPGPLVAGLGLGLLAGGARLIRRFKLV